MRHDLSSNSWTSGFGVDRNLKNEKSSLDNLPNEVLFLIISKLDGYSLKSIRKTSKKFLNLTDNLVGYAPLRINSNYRLFSVKRG